MAHSLTIQLPQLGKHGVQCGTLGNLGAMPHTDILDKLGDKGLRITFRFTSGFWHFRVIDSDNTVLAYFREPTSNLALKAFTLWMEIKL